MMKKNVWDDVGICEGGVVGDWIVERFEGARGEIYRDDARAVSRMMVIDWDGRGVLVSEGL